jgi:predicted transcriptional regulator
MRIATGTIVDGKIAVNDPEFKDGTDVFIVTREREDDVHLSAEELAELEAGIAEADRGDLIPGEEFFARLRSHE